MVTHHDIQAAVGRISGHILKTPVVGAGALGMPEHTRGYLKLENRQYTGSFKARGALNKVLMLQEQGVTGPVVTASTGNHGLGVARALEITGMAGILFVPGHIAPAKLAALRQFPIDIRMVKGDPLLSEMTAKAYAREAGLPWISPYNDRDVIAGQGTIGPELTAELADIAAVYVTIGGGGLVSGIATWLAHAAPKTEIIGCLPARSPEMQLSVEAGQIVHLGEAEETLSDGSAGGCEDGSITFPICQQLVSRYLLIEEAAIAAAMAEVYHHLGETIEGSAGVAVAAMQQDAHRYPGATVISIICGGNIDQSRFESILRTWK